MTKEHEIFILENFKLGSKNFPEGEIQKSEKPDFIIKSHKNKIGIVGLPYCNSITDQLQQQADE